jgi:DNA-binding transcriptional regulator YhcF (GntR family)
MAMAEALRQRLLSGLYLGALRAGDRLPSVRDLAAEFEVDQRVVLGAYRELEAEGLVELRQRSGIYFAPAARDAGRHRSRWAEWLVDATLRGLGHGVALPDFPEYVRRSLLTVRPRAVCIECNADQVEGLCEELRLDYGLETVGENVFRLMDRDRVPRAVQGADLLVTTTFHAGEVRELATRWEKPWLAMTLRADLFAHIARLLPAGPVYFVVADPRYAEKLRKIFSNTGGAAHLRVLVAGVDDVSRIPDGAPAYVSRAARAALGDAPVARRITPEPRALSTASSRELVAFIVQRNMDAWPETSGAGSAAGPG